MGESRLETCTGWFAVMQCLKFLETSSRFLRFLVFGGAHVSITTSAISVKSIKKSKKKEQLVQMDHTFNIGNDQGVFTSELERLLTMLEIAELEHLEDSIANGGAEN